MNGIWNVYGLIIGTNDNLCCIVRRDNTKPPKKKKKTYNTADRSPSLSETTRVDFSNRARSKRRRSESTANNSEWLVFG